MRSPSQDLKTGSKNNDERVVDHESLPSGEYVIEI